MAVLEDDDDDYDNNDDAEDRVMLWFDSTLPIGTSVWRCRRTVRRRQPRWT